jgi:hypothetical protein
MAQTSVIANEIREHIAHGASEAALIALVAELADQYPDMTIEQLADALHEAIEDHRPGQFDGRAGDWRGDR